MQFRLVLGSDPLDELILHVLKLNRMNLTDGDFLVLAQKIVSKSEERWVNIGTIQKFHRAIDLGGIIEHA